MSKSSRTLTQPPVKLACLECRSCKVRCNGEDPCNNCTKRSKFCEYKASQRGGLRKRRRGGQTDDELDIDSQEDLFSAALYNLSMPTDLMQNLDLPGSPFPRDALDSLANDPSESIPIRVYRSESDLSVYSIPPGGSKS
ncbi:hypothetical protein FE257_001434 [Aspergillus nanangensis]|uniref:Zn(2)-C6 fungal-type domain-containing protein n=1 Tax=Aspergillus nanangensis TaxID=2582783 RepID=A0AAD4CF94_ASPNN|nr:hypothetical protein FE257_001434 [Aspergillus nanangensis]